MTCSSCGFAQPLTYCCAGPGVCGSQVESQSPGYTAPDWSPVLCWVTTVCLLIPLPPLLPLPPSGNAFLHPHYLVNDYLFFKTQLKCHLLCPAIQALGRIRHSFLYFSIIASITLCCNSLFR